MPYAYHMIKQKDTNINISFPCNQSNDDYPEEILTQCLEIDYIEEFLFQLIEADFLQQKLDKKKGEKNV